MWHSPEFDDGDEAIFLAGERVSPGYYRLVGGTGRQIILETDDVLPGTLDGRVACYIRVDNTWEQIAREAHA
jgi:hypothetical protein